MPGFDPARLPAQGRGDRIRRLAELDAEIARRRQQLAVLRGARQVAEANLAEDRAELRAQMNVNGFFPELEMLEQLHHGNFRDEAGRRLLAHLIQAEQPAVDPAVIGNRLFGLRRLLADIGVPAVRHPRAHAWTSVHQTHQISESNAQLEMLLEKYGSDPQELENIDYSNLRSDTKREISEVFERTFRSRGEASTGTQSAQVLKLEDMHAAIDYMCDQGVSKAPVIDHEYVSDGHVLYLARKMIDAQTDATQREQGLVQLATGLGSTEALCNTRHCDEVLRALYRAYPDAFAAHVLLRFDEVRDVMLAASKQIFRAAQDGGVVLHTDEPHAFQRLLEAELTRHPAITTHHQQRFIRDFVLADWPAFVAMVNEQ